MSFCLASRQEIICWFIKIVVVNCIVFQESNLLDLLSYLMAGEKKNGASKKVSSK
jgi:hypothetical protein